ncbi:ester cyclase [Paraburkholderia sabiae]|nr:ester cyclase [Paraburkholderia sabiae]
MYQKQFVTTIRKIKVDAAKQHACKKHRSVLPDAAPFNSRAAPARIQTKRPRKIPVPRSGRLPNSACVFSVTTGRVSSPDLSIAARNGWQMTPCVDKVQSEGSNSAPPPTQVNEESIMSMEDDNKSIVARWFNSFWGKTCNLDIVDELAAPDMLLRYSLHEPRSGRKDIKAFMTSFREAFPDLNFWGVADLIAEKDYVVGRWEGGGTHTGPAFSDFLIGSLPAATGRKMHFTGTTVLRLKDGRIVEEIGLDDGVTALQQLGLIKVA